MSNFKVSSDVDEILRKSTKAEVNAFLGVNTIKSNTDTNTADIATNASAIALNTAKTGITTAQASAIVANTNKVGITAEQASAITNNTAKVGITTTQATAISSNTANIATANTNIATANTNIATANTNIATNATNIATKAPLDSPDFTGDVTFETDVLVIDSNNNFVGINKTTPSVDLDVSGDVNVSGDLYASNYLGGTGAFADTSISGDLQVNGDASITGDLSFSGDGALSGDVTVSGELSVDQSIDCPEILATTGTIGEVKINSTDLVFETNNSNSVKLSNGGMTLSQSSTSLIKEDCYFKGGAVRLQKASSADDEILMRYLGQNSNDFVIQQFSGGNEKGHIKFLGNTADGCKVRLEADHVDIGYNRSGFETDLVKIYSDTNIGADKKLAFTDTRDATDGLQFYHTGVRSTTGEAGRDAIQMGMYGSYPDSNIGEFKITHKIGTASNTDVLSVSPSASEVKIHKPLNLGNVPVFADNTAASTLSAGDVYRTSTGALMIKY